MNAQKHALLIGVNEYDENSSLAPLRFAEADAKALAEVLKELYGFKVTLLTGEKARREQIFMELENLAQSWQEGIFLFFFAGHG